MSKNFSNLNSNQKISVGIASIVSGVAYFFTRYFDNYPVVAWLILIAGCFAGVKLIVEGIKGRRKNNI